MNYLNLDFKLLAIHYSFLTDNQHEALFCSLGGGNVHFILNWN